VEERQYPADAGVAHAGQPSRLEGRQRVDVPTRDLDEEHLLIRSSTASPPGRR